MTNPPFSFLGMGGRVAAWSWLADLWIVSIAEDGYLYFTNNLLNLAPNFNSGIDNRRKPYSLFRVPLPDGGRKIMLR